LCALLFLGEPISWTIVLSTGVVCLGLWVVYRAELKQGYIVSSKPDKPVPVETV
jgi:drug/metabolite transporter (DMT)-like permease